MLWRLLMFRTTVIAITGSAGKSTTTALLGEILSRHYSTNWLPGGRNSHPNLVKTLLATRWHHRYTVIEVGTREPGTIPRLAWLVQPDIAIVTQVLHFHSNRFPTIESVAAEKAALPAWIGRRGAVFLNADNPHVAAMASRCRARVFTFGQAADADLRISNLQSAWPERLRFTAHHLGKSIPVQSQMIADHMATPIAAALAVAIHCGVSLPDAAQVVASVEPVNGRLRPMAIPSGAVVWRDDQNSSLPTLEVSLAALRQAHAVRRIVIAGDVVDSQLPNRPRMRRVAQLVAESADFAIFIGKDYAKAAAKEARESGMAPDSVLVLLDWRALKDWLHLHSRAGDVILLNCVMKAHLERAVLAQFGEISCYLPECQIVDRCDECKQLGLIQIENALPASPTP